MAFRRALLGVASTVVVGLIAACAEPNFGDDLDDSTLPARPASRDDGGDHASLPARSADTDGADASVVDPNTIAMEAGTVDAAPVRSALCSEADLLICYEFEGNVKDSSINAIDPESVTGVAFVPGKVGLGAALTASSTIHLPSSPMWTVTAATIEAWVAYSPAANAKGVVFDADGRFGMEIETNGQLKCITGNNSVTGGTVVKGTLTHVACTFDGSKIRNYVGGIERDNDNGHLGTSDSNAAIGGNAPAGDPFVGTIDSVRVFRTARTAAEIALAAQ